MLAGVFIDLYMCEGISVSLSSALSKCIYFVGVKRCDDSDKNSGLKMQLKTKICVNAVGMKNSCVKEYCSCYLQ